MTHLIQRQVLEIQLPDKEMAREQQEEIRQGFWERIVPALDEAFSQIVPENEILRIEKLSLDIGAIPYEDLEQKVIEGVIRQIKGLYRYSNQGDTNPAVTLSVNQQPSKAVLIKQSPLKAVQFFLQHGILPWWYTTDTSSQPIAQLIADFTAREQQELILFLGHPKHEKSVKRLLKQVPAAQIRALIRWTNPLVATQIVLVKEVLQGIKVLREIDKTAWLHALEEVFEKFELGLLPTLLSSRSSIVTDRIGSQIVQDLAAALAVKTALIHELIQENWQEKEVPSISSIAQIFPKKDLPEQQAQEKKPNATDPMVIDLSIDPIVAEVSITKDGGIDKVGKNPTPQEPRAGLMETLEEGIYIQNAGLVLLAPFLPLFFKELGLVEQRSFVSVEAQERALLLSNYLVNNQAHAPEYELLLNKLLTAWPLEEPIELRFEVHPDEEQQAEALLSSVLKHWGGLGNSGTGALQETFLQREGKLIAKDEHYQLIVDRRSLDILMEKIPWSYGMIKLPWMDTRILVEW